ncbi:MAG: SDR family NAD(P)-dependent oxidoreductase [Anaerolineaceae bacterium]|nr:SDR family NAD(P)-dependent oxidoreductase [Anaerolineaceae bacterium]
MKIFLTGGTGFIGRALTQTLLQRGWDVVVLVRKPDSLEAKAIQTLGGVLFHGDITDPDSMREAMQGADVVIHNAGWYEFGITRKMKGLMRTINVQGTVNTLDLAIELGVPKIIYVSSMVAYGATGDIIADENFQRQAPPQSWYEQTKTEAHDYAVKLQKQGAPIIIVCPVGVIGPGDHSNTGHLVRMYVRGVLPPVLWAPNGRCSHVYLDDVAEAMTRSVEYGRIGETYILSNGVMQHKDMVALWSRTPGGCKKTLLWMPNSMALLFSKIAERIERLLGLPVVFSSEFALATFARYQFSAAKAERELGMRFRSLEQAWFDTLKAERSIAKKNRQSL